MSSPEENKVIDPVYYIAFANPKAVQAILYSYGFPPAVSFDDLYSQISKVNAMYPDEVGKKLMDIHPDKNKILAAIPQKKHFGLCNLCKSNFTDSELQQFSNDESKKSKDDLKKDLDSLNTALYVASHGIIYDQATVDGINQKIAIVTGLMNASSTTATTAVNTNQPTGFSLSNLNATQKTIGIASILVLLGITIVAFTKS